jgi:thiamine biosynthesis lipoprotein
MVLVPNPGNKTAAALADLNRPARWNSDFKAFGVAERIFGSAQTGFRDGGHELVFRALGTTCRIVIAGAVPAVTEFFDAALRWVIAFEAKYSRFLPESLVSQINREAGNEWVTLDPEAERIFALCHELNFLTRGIFDPTALPVIALWNWKEARTTLPTDAEVSAARDRVGWRQVQRAPGKLRLSRAGMCLDLGGMGKEYAVDQIVLLAQRSGFASVLVDFGADVRVSGPPPDQRPAWFIGLENPAHPGACWTGVAVRDGAVATSGDYLRKFELNGRRFGHIVDPRTGRPVATAARAVSVIAPSCTQAGMLSTAAFVLGPAEGLKLIESTPGAAGAITTETQILQSNRFHEYVVS